MSKCEWIMDNESCFGNVERRLIFRAQLEIPMCDGHFDKHLKLMVLEKHTTQDSFREILELSNSEREAYLQSVCEKNGLDINECLSQAASKEKTSL